MKIINVVPEFKNEADGVANVVRNLSNYLLKSDVDVKVATLNGVGKTVSDSMAKYFGLGIGPRRLGVSPSMKKWLIDQVRQKNVDIIHNHSLWMMPNVYSGQVVRNSNCKLIISPHGTLSEAALARNALLKNLFYSTLQGPALRLASCFHASAESEYLDIRRLGIKQPICIIPNGVHVPDLLNLQPVGRRRLLFLGRIHPIKGLINLLHAWAQVQNKFLDWELHIAGPDNSGHLAKAKLLSTELKLKRVFFLGPLYGEEKLRTYREASLYVLPTYSENFGITIAEALASGTPVITTKGAPWEGLIKNNAGWWIDVGIDPLVECLNIALSVSQDQLISMGASGKEWMSQDFSWPHIAKQFFDTYSWIRLGGTQPKFVKLF